MPPNAFGLEGQSFGDFLNQSDTPTLRNKYYDTLDLGLNSAGDPAEIDQGAALWQGIIPALATALLTKGKSLGFSGGPLLGVLDTQQKLAERKKTLSVESKLKGAGLLGEELGRRESLATATANKQEDREQRAELQRENIASREQIAAENRAGRAETAAMMGAFRQDAANDRDAKAAFSETNTVVDDYEREVKPYREAARNVGQIITLAQTAKENPENAKASLGMLAGLSIQLSQGGGRVSDKDIQLVGGNSADATLNKWQNWIDGGARGTMPEMTPEAIMIASRAMGKALSAEYLKTEAKYRTRTEMMEFGNKEKVNKYIDQGNPFPQEKPISPTTKFQTKAGPRTYEQLKAVPGFTDDMLTNLQRIE